MADYTLHMQMIAALRPFYPHVPVTLHAGELAPGLVPPEGLRFHIRQAIAIAGAQRIGHGVDVMYEDQPYELLKTMADRHILVEINLTSNDVILGIQGKDHPLPLYRKYGVPVALSTDDEGVSRIDLTHEYSRLPKPSASPIRISRKWCATQSSTASCPATACGAITTIAIPSRRALPVSPVITTRAPPAPPCLAASPKAQQQWRLEERFHRFERAQGPDPH